MDSSSWWSGYVHNGTSLKRRVSADARGIPGGGRCAAVYECIGEDAERNAALLADRFLTLLTLAPPDFTGDPRRGVRLVWRELEADLRLNAPVRNAVSFAVVLAAEGMLLCARKGLCSISVAGPRGFRTVVHASTRDIVAVHACQRKPDPMVILGTDLFWQGADVYAYPRSCMRLPNIGERCQYLHDCLLLNGMRVRSHAAVLLDLLPFRS